jgi:3D-(3,5/4)-trihydroxycyclohexane-1,2-dione acylhydrolase (decyclizing)
VQGPDGVPQVDFAAHAAALGADAVNVDNLAEFEAAMLRARASQHTCVIAIQTDPDRTTEPGGWWWDVAVPEVSERAEVVAAHDRYMRDKRAQRP